MTEESQAFYESGNKNAYQRMKERVEQYRDALKNIPVGMYIYHLENMDDDGTLRLWVANPAATQLTGVPAEDMLNKTIDDNFPGLREKGIPKLLADVVRSHRVTEIDNLYYGDDRVVAAIWSLKVFPLPDQCVGLILDNVTEHKKAQEALDKSEERFRLVARATNDALWDWDLVTNKIWWNDGIYTLFGFLPGQVGPDVLWWTEHIHPEDRDRIVSGIRTVINSGDRFWSDEYRFSRADGTFAHVFDRGYVMPDEKGQPIRMIGAMLDITDRKRAEDQLLRNAFYDILTGLPNRALFMDRLGRSIERAKRRKDYVFAALFMDFDRFKVVNESLGHAVGDQLLIAIARRLETCLRPSDTFARLGGDEFVILLEDVKDISDATRIADRIQKELTLPFDLNGQEIFTAVSIGIAFSAKGYDRSEELLRDAEMAMYRAKSHGKARYETFDTELHSKAVGLLRMEADLRRAVERQEFLLYYQPIISLQTGQITSCESLLRWKRAPDEFISPVDFIPIAEETGLIIPIGEWVLRTACAQNKAWQAAGLPAVPVTINISARQFKQKDLSHMIAQVLRETALDSKFLRLELTESVVVENAEEAVIILKELKALGVELSMDDFGTGYSSLTYLKRFPFDSLKIDRSFVNNITQNADDAAIAAAIISLAHNLKLKVVAEGVETEKQVLFLRAQHCDEAQGYLFSRPVPAEVFVDLIKEGKCISQNV